LAVGSLAGGARSASACSCIQLGGPREAYGRAALVFEGRLIDKAGDEEQGNLPHNFAVTRVWKGPVAPLITVYTGSGGGDCGYGFDIGETYLVYASYWEYEATFMTSICDRTRPIGQAGADIAAHGEPRYASWSGKVEDVRLEPTGEQTSEGHGDGPSEGSGSEYLLFLVGAATGSIVTLIASRSSRRPARDAIRLPDR
jgi:hypothetical protein